MIRKGMTIREAAEAWVTTFNAIQQGMIERLMLHDYDDWHEVTVPIAGDQVYVYELPENIETLEYEGEIISFDKESKLYCIMLYDGTQISIAEDCFEVKYDASLPMWGTMWSFRDGCDDWWLEKGDGIQIMSECGFRVYESDEFGYFFGIDGCGYDFYESHWISCQRTSVARPESGKSVSDGAKGICGTETWNKRLLVRWRQVH